MTNDRQTKNASSEGTSASHCSQARCECRDPRTVWNGTRNQWICDDCGKPAINNVTITFPNGKVFEERSNKNTNVGKNTYRRLKSSIVFYNIKDKPFLALLSKKEYAFFVSCRLKTHVTSDGVEHKNVYYFCETEKMDGKAVGLDRLTYIKKSSFAKQVAKRILTKIG